MAVSFGSVGTYAFPTSASFNIAVPSGVAANSLITAHIYKESSEAVTPPAGFTEAVGSPVNTSGASSHYHHLFWKRATGADSGSYTFSQASGSIYREVVAIRWEGVIQAGLPWDFVTFASTGSTNATQTPDVSGILQMPYRMLVWVGMDRTSSTCAGPGGFTYTAGADSLTARDISVYRVVAGGTGSTGNQWASFPGSTAPLTAAMFALRDADPVSLTPSRVVQQAALRRASYY